ncbi:MAG: hypothetical protein FWE21_09405 [Defluviitaleaceae bacterium]|nr:hypothetical protein [Defluviitaleaceae bacterium]
MATEKEIRERQMSALYDLLKLVQDYPEIAENKGIKDLIKKAKAVMDKEDVAWVEKTVAE